MSTATAPPHRIFVSYSRADQAYAVAQRARIEAEGLSLWQDITHMEGGNVGGWWDQIRQRLEHRATEHMVLFVSSDSLASGIVADEWRYARRQGVEVHLARVPGKLGKAEFDTMPAGLAAQHFYDLAVEEQFSRLTAALKGPTRQLKVPMMAPMHDEHFVLRDEEASKLIMALLRAPDPAASDKSARAVGIAAALRGAGGYGKTQLARWLCQQQRLVDHFYDGVMWVELGENPDTTGGLQSRVEFLIAQLRRTLTDEDRGFPNATAAAKRLFELLDKGGTKDKGRYLLVIDDAWRKSDVDLFMGGAPSTVRLVTTRIDETLPLGTDKIPVDAMKPAEAVELLAVGLGGLGVGKVEVEAKRAELVSLAGRLGEWALLLSLTNGQLRSEIQAGSALPEAIAFVGRIYDEMGLTAFDPKDETQRSRVAALSIGASLRHLSADEIARFEDLAIFPEDEHIPVTTIGRLWARTGGMGDLAGQFLLRKLKRYALLMSLDLKSGEARLHDVMRKYLTQKQSSEALKGLHRRFVEAYDATGGPDIVDANERRYFYKWLPAHLSEAGERNILNDLLVDPQWMQRKLRFLSNPTLLISDYTSYATEGLPARLGQALLRSSGILSRDAGQLMTQILARIPESDPASRQLRSLAMRQAEPPLIFPLIPSLSGTSPELTCLHVRESAITALAKLKNRAIASGHYNGSIQVWDWGSHQRLLHISTSHDPINAIVQIDDNTLLSGSSDGSLALVDMRYHAITTIGEIPRGVKQIELLRSDLAVVLGFGGRIYFVNLSDRSMPSLLADTSNVSTLAATKEQLALLYEDGRLSIYDAHTLNEICRAQTPCLTAKAIAPLSEQCFAISATGSMWAFRLETSHATKCGESNSGAIVSIATDLVAADGERGAIELWDMSRGMLIASLRGHTAQVWTLCSLDGDLLASGAEDTTIRIWDLKQQAEPLTAAGPAISFAHDAEILALAKNSAGLVAASSRDGKISIWDQAELRVQKKLLGHHGYFHAMSFVSSDTLAFGFIKSGGNDWPGAESEDDDQCGLQVSRVTTAQQIDCFASSAGQIVELHCTADDRLILKFEREAGYFAFDTSRKTIEALQVEEGAIYQFVPQSDVALCFVDRNTEKFRSRVPPLALRRMSDGSSLGLIEGWRRHYISDLSLALSPCAEWLAASDSKHIQIWNVKRGVEPIEINGHEDIILCMGFLSGDRLLSGSYDSTLRVWDTDSRSELCRIEMDVPVTCLLPISERRVVVGDRLGRLHWLQVVE